MQKIAIEQNLTPVKEYLSNKGYHVESINFSQEYTRQMDKYDALVITGSNRNFLGINDTNTKAVIIDAKGMSPEQVYHKLRSQFEG